MKIGKGKRLSREKVNRAESTSARHNRAEVCARNPSHLRSEVESVEVSVPIVWSHWRKASGLTLVTPESSSSAVNDCSAFTVSTVSQQTEHDVRPVTQTHCV